MLVPRFSQNAFSICGAVVASFACMRVFAEHGSAAHVQTAGQHCLRQTACKRLLPCTSGSAASCSATMFASAGAVRCCARKNAMHAHHLLQQSRSTKGCCAGWTLECCTATRAHRRTVVHDASRCMHHIWRSKHCNKQAKDETPPLQGEATVSSRALKCAHTLITLVVGLTLKSTGSPPS